MTWLALAACSAVLLGLYDVSKKAALDANAVLPVLFACSLAGLVFALPAPVLTWLEPELAAQLGVALVSLSAEAHLLVLAKAFIVTLSWVLTFFAIKHLPLSLAAPIRASAPLFTLVGAVLLFAERPSLFQWLGIVVILAAYFAFSLIGRLEGIHFQKNRWVWMIFAGTLVGAVSGLYDKHLMQAEQLPPITMQFWFTLYNAVLQGLIVLIAWRPTRRKTTPYVFRPSILWVGLLLLVADALYFRALADKDALIAVVSAVRRSNVVVSFAVGSLAFGERYKTRKAFALLGVLLGLFLLLQ
jgi:transporter family protein